MKRRLTILGSLAGAGVVVGGFSWVANHFDTSVKLISAISPIVTVSLALFAVHMWRVQLVMKRRFEVAEEALQTSQRVVYAFSEVRSAFGLSGEGQTRKRKENEKPEESERLDHAFVPFERLNHFNELFATMAKSTVMVEIHLGSNLAQHMRNLLGIRGHIIIAARGMERLSRRDFPTANDEKRMNTYMAALYEGFGDGEDDPSYRDVLTKQINSSFAEIQTECRKYLGTPKLKDSLALWN